EDARQFAGGAFCTIYLAPYNYHRIHAPLGGGITGYVNMPGQLRPVNPIGLRNVEKLFCVNERLTTFLKTPRGACAVVAVGATNVGRIRAVYDDDPWIRIGHLHLIEQAARELFPLYGYREARTPVLERTELFVRGIGEVTDIVGKEMYTFDDHGDKVSMRPENTASLVRAYVEHNVNQQEPETKWWYVGPMFRRERQQRGRYRQFTQIGIEAFGSPGPRVDAEQIELLDRWLRAL